VERTDGGSNVFDHDSRTKRIVDRDFGGVGK